MTPIVRAINLSKRFKGPNTLDDLSLDVPEGSIFGLVGPNGAGKTTTIKVLMNMLKPTSGRAEVFGIDSRKLGPSEFASIGYVSENQELPDWMTLDQLLNYLRPFYPTWDDGLAKRMVHQFALPADRQLRHLSRGMWMKVALVASLAYRPRLLVLDEPFSGLDPLIRQDLTEGLLEQAGETTILVSSHDLADIESFVSHVGYLDRGRIRFAEEMETLAARFREIEVNVDPPCQLPSKTVWPVDWLQPAASQAKVRFVDTHFEAEQTANEIRRLFAGVRDITVQPMPLRAIFITLARESSRHV